MHPSQNETPIESNTAQQRTWLSPNVYRWLVWSLFLLALTAFVVAAMS